MCEWWQVLDVTYRVHELNNDLITHVECLCRVPSLKSCVTVTRFTYLPLWLTLLIRLRGVRLSNVFGYLTEISSLLIYVMCADSNE